MSPEDSISISRITCKPITFLHPLVMHHLKTVRISNSDRHDSQTNNSPPFTCPYSPEDAVSISRITREAIIPLLSRQIKIIRQSARSGMEYVWFCSSADLILHSLVKSLGGFVRTSLLNIKNKISEKEWQEQEWTEQGICWWALLLNGYILFCADQGGNIHADCFQCIKTMNIPTSAEFVHDVVPDFWWPLLLNGSILKIRQSRSLSWRGVRMRAHTFNETH